MSRVRGRRELVERLGRINKETVARVTAALRRGARKVENRAVEGIIDPPKTGKVYSKGTKGRKKKDGTWGSGSRTKIHRASAPGEFPAADTGRLHQSITGAQVPAPPGTIRFEVGANAPYALVLELGSEDGVTLQPRPFMAPALRENEAEIRNDIAEAVRRGSRKR